MICRYGAKLIIDGEMTGGDLLIVRIEFLAPRLILRYRAEFIKTMPLF